MLCPKCKTNNPDEAVFCISCGQKMKVLCPKCKTPNQTSNAKCTNCNLTLIRYCPVCAAPNKPLNLKCQDCDAPLLKKCPKCQTINLISATQCKKCSTPLNDNVKTYKPHLALRVELANYDFFTKIENKDVAKKLISKFFQIILASAKGKDLKVLKIAPYAAGIEFKNTKETTAIDTAINVMKEVQKANNAIAKLNIAYDIKIIVSEVEAIKHDFGGALLEKAPMNFICADEKTAVLTKDKYNYKKSPTGLYRLEIAPASKPTQKEVTKETKIKQAPQVEQKPAQKPEPVTQKTEEAPRVEAEQTQTSPQQQAPKAEQAEPTVPKPAAQPNPEPRQPIQTKEPEVQEEKVQSEPIIEPTIEPQQEEPAPKPQQKPQPTPEIKKPTAAQEPRPEVSAPKPVKGPRSMATEALKNAIKRNQGGFFVLSAEPGFGKSALINKAMLELQEQNLCVLQLDCHYSIQNDSFAAIQNLIRSMFSLPITNVDVQQIKGTVDSALRHNINISDNEAISTILNLLVPEPKEEGNIDEAFNKLQYALSLLFNAIKKMQNLLIVIEDMEYLDQASAELINALMEDGFLNDAYIIATTSNNTHPSMFFSSTQIQEKEIGNIKLLPLNTDEINESIDFYVKNPNSVPGQLRAELHKKTKGWALFIEEIILFLTQMGLISADESGNITISPNVSQIALPSDLEELLTVRFDNLFQQSELLYQIVAHATCLGYTFFPPVIQAALDIDDETFSASMHSLLMSGLFITIDNTNFKFKNKFIFEVAQKLAIKTDEQQLEITANLLSALEENTKASGSQMALMAQNGQNFQKAFKLWSRAVKETLSTGDNYLYLRCQKGALDNIDYSDYPDKEASKIAISEQLGIANYEKSPEEAIDLLSKVIKSYEETNNIEKVIFLSGYIVKSLTIAGNIQEALGYIEKSIEFLNTEKNPIEIALLKFLKLKLLVETGNLGEVINLIQTEILPALHEGIQKQSYPDPSQFESIQEAVVQSQIILIKALALQGNKNYYNAIEAFASNNEITAKEAEIFAIDAIHKTFNGQPDASEASIKKTISILKPAKVANKENLMLELEFTSMLNKFFYTPNYSIAQDVGPIAQKAKKLNNSYIYNFLQLIFAKQLINTKDVSSAANLINDCLTFFAEQKIAMFAIPSWAMLSQIQLIFEDYEQAVSIAQQALEVAMKPQIQNNYFILFIKNILAECFIKKGDLEMAKMHLEEGINFAKENDLLFWEGTLYISLGHLHRTLSEQNIEKEANLAAAKELFTMVQEIGKTMQSKHLLSTANKELAQIS